MSKTFEGVFTEFEKTGPNEALFAEMLKQRGYKNMSHFANTMGISRANLWDRLHGMYSVSVPFLYKIAECLGCAFDDALKVFYPSIYSESRKNAGGTYLNKETGEVWPYRKVVEYCRENYDYGDETNMFTYSDNWAEEYGFEKIGDE